VANEQLEGTRHVTLVSDQLDAQFDGGG